MQKILRLSVRPLPGETSRNLEFRKAELRTFETTGHGYRTISPEKLFADILKRQSRRIMSDVSECPPDSIPAHLARLDDWREIVEHVLRHDYRETAESNRSGAALVNCFTLADYLAAAEITRRQHRAPAFVNDRDAMLEKIFRGIDQLAGLIAKDGELVEFLATAERSGL